MGVLFLSKKNKMILNRILISILFIDFFYYFFFQSGFSFSINDFIGVFLWYGLFMVLKIYPLIILIVLMIINVFVSEIETPKEKDSENFFKNIKSFFTIKKVFTLKQKIIFYCFYILLGFPTLLISFILINGFFTRPTLGEIIIGWIVIIGYLFIGTGATFWFIKNDTK